MGIMVWILRIIWLQIAHYTDPTLPTELLSRLPPSHLALRSCRRNKSNKILEFFRPAGSSIPWLPGSSFNSIRIHHLMELIDGRLSDFGNNIFFFIKTQRKSSSLFGSNKQKDKILWVMFQIPSKMSMFRLFRTKYL